MITFANVPIIQANGSLPIEMSEINLDFGADYANKPVTVILLKPNMTFESFTKARGAEVNDTAEDIQMSVTDETGAYVYTPNDYGSLAGYTVYAKCAGKAIEKKLKTSGHNVDIHVAVNGDDSADGSEDTPVATLQKTKELAEQYDCDVTIKIHAGTYYFDSSVEFASDNADSRLTVTNAGDGEVIFSGAKKIDVSSLVPVTDKTVLNRLQSGARDKVLQADLSAFGLTKEMVDFESRMSTGNLNITVNSLYLNGKEQNISRWPDDGYAKIGKVIEKGATHRWSSSNERHNGGTFEYIDNQPSRWANNNDIIVDGYFGSEYRYEYASIKNLDTENKRITFKNWTMYGIVKGFRWRAKNILEEINLPGEWAIDPDNMLLYYYPSYELSQNDVLEFNALDVPFITMTNANNIAIKGITFDKCAYTAITASGCNDVEITDCVISNTDNEGIRAAKGKNINISSNTLYNIDGIGIYISGGDRDNLISANNVISDNHMYNIAKNVMNPAIMLGSQVSGTVDYNIGTKVSNNLIHNSEFAIGYRGNLNKIENNELYNGVRNSADMTMIGIGRTLVDYGNEINYNYIHDFGPVNFTDSTYGNYGIFWDDMASGQIARGNIIRNNFYRGSQSISIGGGRDNTVENNIILETNRPINFHDRTIGSTTSYEDFIKNNAAYLTLQEVDYENLDAWKEKFPSMYSIVDDVKNDQGWIPRNITATGNVAMNNTVSVSSDNGRMTKYGNVKNNVNLAEDYSIFVDAENQDFRIKKAAKEKLGLADGIPDESYTNTIGLLNPRALTNTDFHQVYPENNAKLYSDNVMLRWEQALFADEYKYELAEDSDFTDIVAEGTTINTNAEVKNLEKGKKYYWRVTAKNISRQLSGEWSSAQVYSFTAASDELIIENEGYYVNDSFAARLSDITDEATVKYTVSNGGQEKKYSYLLAVYNSDETLIQVASGQDSIAANASGIEKNFSFTKKCVTDNTSCARLYIWDGTDTMKPLCSRKIYMS